MTKFTESILINFDLIVHSPAWLDPFIDPNTNINVLTFHTELHNILWHLIKLPYLHYLLTLTINSL